MTETLEAVNPPPSKKPAEPDEEPQRSPSSAELASIEDLVRRAREQGVALTGPDGLLKALTKTVLEAALDEEMAEHLGYDKHAPEGRNLGNSRNGKRGKTVLTDSCGEVEIEVPRDRHGSFEPQLVKKRQRRLSDVDEVVLSLYAKGLTTGEISAHFADVYGASVSKDTVSRITDRVVEEMQGWWARPLEKVYAAVFIDAIVVKIRDGQVRNRPVYAAIGVDLDGHRDILFVVCDGLKGLPDSVNAAFPAAIVQTCVIHLIRNTFRYASRKYWDQISHDLKPIYTAPTPTEARRRYEEFAEKWGTPY